MAPPCTKWYQEVKPIRRSDFSFGYTALAQFFILHFPYYIPHMDIPLRNRAVSFGLSCLSRGVPRTPAWGPVLGEANWVGKDGTFEAATVLDTVREMESQRVRRRLVTEARRGDVDIEDLIGGGSFA